MKMDVEAITKLLDWCLLDDYQMGLYNARVELFRAKEREKEMRRRQIRMQMLNA